jgi:DNA-binding response OmpR family regulator
VRILVVEDNPRMLAAVAEGLREQAYAVDTAEDADDGRRLAALHPYDLIILDVVLPDGGGVELCKWLRSRGVDTPVLFLTASSATEDKVRGLDAGADDYLTKPFEFDELVSRVRTLLRRGAATESAVLRVGDVELDLARRTARRGGRPLQLTKKEYALLEFLVRRPDRVLTRAQISEHVWDMNFDPLSNVIDVYISTLRKKLDTPEDPPTIHTVVGGGYMFSVGSK